MDARQFSAVLGDIRAIFAEAGATAIEKDFALLTAFFVERGEVDLDDVLADVEAALDPKLRKRVRVARALAELREASLDEGAFNRAISTIRSDSSLDKNDILELLKAYGVIRIQGRSKDAYLEALSKHFYWLLYNKDADALAKRATPW